MLTDAPSGELKAMRLARWPPRGEHQQPDVHQLTFDEHLRCWSTLDGNYHQVRDLSHLAESGPPRCQSPSSPGLAKRPPIGSAVRDLGGYYRISI